MQVIVKADETHTGDALEAGLRAAGFEVGLSSRSESSTLPGGNGVEAGIDPDLMITVGATPVPGASGLGEAVVVALPKGWATDRQVRVAADVAGALRQAVDQGLPHDAIVVGDVVIEVAGHAVYRRGVPIDLTHREFLLLTLLAQHPNRVLDRDSLMERLWGPEAVTPNTIEVHISSLRRKLEAFGPRMIFTVRRVGYVLRPGGLAAAPTSDAADAVGATDAEVHPVDPTVVLNHEDLGLQGREPVRSGAL
jgi:DNA-binding winged helix-turn-helix (wHTH) protein